MDRIDIHLDVPRVPYDDLVKLKKGDNSVTIRARVDGARAIQQERFAPLGKTNMLINADMGPAEVQQFCELDSASTNLMRAAMQQMQLSARGYHRTLKLARTIADLAGSEKVEMYHLAEALQYRPKVIGG